jgi:hypothetical protein
MSPEEGTVEDGVFDVLVTGSAGQTVTLAASGLPSGASLSFSPATVATGSQSSVLVLAGSAPLGTYTITITATGANSEGFAEVTMPVTLGPCIPYTITCSDACGAQSNGCGGTVECGGCPTGKTCQEGTCKLANCTTPECECVQSGGEWDGKYCE